MTDASMSQEEAQKEYDDIQAEIAKEKGLTPEKEDPEEKEDAEEPAGDEDDEGDGDRVENLRENPADDDDETIEPHSKSKDDRKVPLSKYQDTKKTLETELSARDQKIADLTAELNRTKTEKSVGEKVKAFAEKHDMSEDTVLDLVQLVRGEAELDSSTKEIIKKSEANLKKQEAEEKLNQEFEDFYAENPDARAHADALRKKALEKDNLSKSLYEVYNRFVKTESSPKKKTGEASRPGTRSSTPTFDVKKVLEKVKSGAAKPFEGLSNDQVDEVFAQMEKEGSRYQ